MCRKWTASLVPQFIMVAPSQISPDLSSQPTYVEYESSPRRYRGFCGRCASPLIWRSADKTETLDFFLGTIDERWLVGEIVPGTEKVTKHGTVFERKGGLGRELCTPNHMQHFQQNVIPGVTDLLKGGKRYLAETVDGEPLP